MDSKRSAPRKREDAGRRLFGAARRRTPIVCAEPVPEDIDLEATSSATLETNPVVIGPDATMEVNFALVVPRASAVKLGIEGRTVLAYGEIRYRDAFSASQTSKFCLAYSVNTAGEPALIPWNRSNEAT